MSQPVTTTTDEDDTILRFLKAAEAQLEQRGRLPFDRYHGITTLYWLRDLVGKIDEDGNLLREQSA